ncbi:GreA/GreB family elongation factor [Rufibacter radiotolerans]|uniref:GreA/GreB family elongation factor n=1 Tax=Rufibacter radiotolerans TaxID=1379910 RepID=A0A0H4VPG9_9BACT|nr:GreA/GreB family elongation factor [Rufibacter radiotolerans]AKQ45604.1 GreA/GreB family elongation factor [Rufibacter radiotolerans]
MSRAFVKEDDAGEAPIIAPRAALPAGTPNYVTPRGLEQLKTELLELELQRAKVEQDREDQANRTRQLTILKTQTNALLERLNSAKVINPTDQPQDQVRFGARVTIETKKGPKPGLKRTFTIVGVDEASLPEGRIAFVAPIAKALQGASLGQELPLKFGPTEEVVQVVEIAYDS